jgi:hypothetical protein
MRCSCGEHDLHPDGPLDTCHFCGHPTKCAPIVDWNLGRLYFPICHACTLLVDFERLYVPVTSAPTAMLERAYLYGEPPLGLAQG